MNQLDLQAIDKNPPPVRPDRWDQAIVAGYIYDVLRPAV
jgi:hypothetical protein